MDDDDGIDILNITYNVGSKNQGLFKVRTAGADHYTLQFKRINIFVKVRCLSNVDYSAHRDCWLPRGLMAV